MSEDKRPKRKVPPAERETKVPPTERETGRVMKPVGVSCALCQLSAGDYACGVSKLTIMYGGRMYGDEGNELVALWKNLYLCDPCIKAIKGAAEPYDLHVE